MRRGSWQTGLYAYVAVGSNINFHPLLRPILTWSAQPRIQVGYLITNSRTMGTMSLENRMHTEGSAWWIHVHVDLQAQSPTLVLRIVILSLNFKSRSEYFSFKLNLKNPFRYTINCVRVEQIVCITIGLGWIKVLCENH